MLIKLTLILKIQPVKKKKKKLYFSDTERKLFKPNTVFLFTERTFSIRKVILTEKFGYGLLIRASGAPSWPKVRAAMTMEQHLPNPFFQLIKSRAIRLPKK